MLLRAHVEGCLLHLCSDRAVPVVYLRSPMHLVLATERPCTLWPPCYRHVEPVWLQAHLPRATSGQCLLVFIEWRLLHPQCSFHVLDAGHRSQVRLRELLDRVTFEFQGALHWRTHLCG